MTNAEQDRVYAMRLAMNPALVAIGKVMLDKHSTIPSALRSELGIAQTALIVAQMEASS